MENDLRLPELVRSTIESSSSIVFASSVNAFEITIKRLLGKVDFAAHFLDNYEDEIRTAGFRELVVTNQHALRVGLLAFKHRDPFDRLLIAQALVEDLVLISNEKCFDAAGVPRLWN